MSISLLVASPDELFRETIRESLLNLTNARVISEYPEVSSNLYIRVLQDLERHPEAALVVDLASDPESALKAMEKDRVEGAQNLQWALLNLVEFLYNF